MTSLATDLSLILISFLNFLNASFKLELLPIFSYFLLLPPSSQHIVLFIRLKLLFFAFTTTLFYPVISKRSLLLSCSIFQLLLTLLTTISSIRVFLLPMVSLALHFLFSHHTFLIVPSPSLLIKLPLLLRPSLLVFHRARSLALFSFHSTIHQLAKFL